MYHFYQCITAVMMFGTIWFFIISSAWLITMFWCVESENNASSIIWTIIYLAFLQFLAKVDFLYTIFHHPLKAISYCVGYLIIGFSWSFIKWWLYVNSRASKVKEARFNFLNEHKRNLERKVDRCATIDIQLIEVLKDITSETKVPPSLMDAWRKSSHYSLYVPRINDYDNNRRITLWVMYWPLSLIWSLINDFVKKLIRTIIMKIKIIYESITALAYKNIEKF